MIASIVIGALVAMAIFLLWGASRVFNAVEPMWGVVVVAAIASILIGVATTVFLEIYL